MRFIGSEFARLKMGLQDAFCCTLTIGRKLLPELPRHDLVTLYRALYGKSPGRLHRALDDARTAAKVWLKLSCFFGHTAPHLKQGEQTRTHYKLMTGTDKASAFL